MTLSNCFSSGCEITIFLICVVLCSSWIEASRHHSVSNCERILHIICTIGKYEFEDKELCFQISWCCLFWLCNAMTYLRKVLTRKYIILLFWKKTSNCKIQKSMSCSMWWKLHASLNSCNFLNFGLSVIDRVRKQIVSK